MDVNSLRSCDRRLAGAAGLLLGAAIGTTFVLLAGVLLAGVFFAGAGAAFRATTSSEPLFDATHLPPLLTAPGEAVELRYDVHCSAGGEAEEAPCDASGTVFVRPGNAGPYRELPLRLDPTSVEGRHVATLPEDVVRSRLGFTYYAVLRTERTGRNLILPAGGADAPQRSLPLERPVDVRLGPHRFGAVHRADARVAEAKWGSGPAEVGLEQGKNLPPIGGSSFDVGRDGSVYVLDEAKRRLLRWRTGAHSSTPVPLAIDGTLADMALGQDGTIYVLESPTMTERSPRLRIFDAAGRAQASVEVAERTAAQVRPGPEGALVLQYPSAQWMPAAIGGRPLGAPAQKVAGRAGRVLPDGREVLVLRRENEIRVAVVSRAGVSHSWRVTSETPLAEVQLAEPVGNRLVLVARVYTDDRDEFVALVLDHGGLVRKHTLASADWAETAPISRFRLVGSSLYQLGSTPAGLFVDRFGLEVK
jgi:hypothetical protein